MKPKFTVSGRIARPVPEVFEAVVAPAILSEYFTTGGAKGRLETGAVVTWDFHDFPGAFPVHVVEAVKDRHILLRWGGDREAVLPDEEGEHRTLVALAFETLDDGRTLVQITEEGWSDTAEGLKASYGNCEGWTGMLAAMKVWLEHGVKLRQGFYK
jgi:uncharacterized protein YndB with AHSA1/START domain